MPIEQLGANDTLIAELNKLYMKDSIRWKRYRHLNIKIPEKALNLVATGIQQHTDFLNITILAQNSSNSSK